MDLDQDLHAGNETEAKASLFTAESRIHGIAPGTGAHR